jgi:TRAP-type C4-dicarboxylate transport system permease small subunit
MSWHADRFMTKNPRLNRCLHGMARFERVLCALAFAVLASALFLDVLLRELIGNGLPWARQVGVYSNIVVALIGIGLASQAGTHLRPRFADGWLPARFESVIAVLQHAVTALFFLGFAAIALQLVFETYQLKEISTVLRTPVWPVQALLPLAFLLGALRHGLYAYDPSLGPVAEEAAE